ncbi:MAG: AraC family transcriptional regulator [Clostridia bacterium]|jgi:xylan 1,4-beta-xylosidase|nr:AraC family transcriptional regulator [Clostridia bacterium]
MQVKREHRRYTDGAKVWAGRYRNSRNTPHWHHDCELLYVECGKLDLIVGNLAFTADSGQAVFIESEQAHEMQALTPDTLVTMLIFDCELVKPFLKEATLSHPLLSRDYGFTQLFEKIETDLKNREPYFEYETAAVVQQLVIDIFRHEKINQVKKSPPSRTVRLKALLAEIDEKYQYFDLTSAASFIGMTPAYFSRLFHISVGMTFSKYLNRVRVEKAVEILKSGEDLSMTEVSLRCGFDSIRNFNRIFKKYTGHTPHTLPKDFILPQRLINLNDAASNPTMAECELIDSSDN